MPTTRSMSKLSKSFDNIKQTYHFEEDTCLPTNDIIPQPFLIRYHGMGHYQVIAKLKGKDNLYFLAMIGGSNGYDREYNEKEYVGLSEKDAISIEEIEALLKNQYH